MCVKSTIASVDDKSYILKLRERERTANDNKSSRKIETTEMSTVTKCDDVRV